MKKSSITVLIIAAILVLLCCCIAFIGGAAWFGYTQVRNVLPTISAYTTTIPQDVTPTPFEITRQPVDPGNSGTLELLKQSTVPERNLDALACSLKNICNVPPTEPPPPSPLVTGAQTQLWILNSDTNQNSKITATLQYITPHAYLWVENGIDFIRSDAKSLMDTFENKIYPTDREFFGSEWTPGVDGDPHIYIIYARNLGRNIAGFFNSADEAPPQVSQYSNAHESFYIDSSQNLADQYTYGTLAHEFQHMIHWYQDPSESSFLNEGFSELATFLNGYDNGGFDWFYTVNPDLPLTDWLGGAGDNSAHYGEDFLFVTYFLDRFGKSATQAVVHDQLIGLDSIDDVLHQLKITDPLTGQPVTADDFFLDWALANYIHDPAVSDGRYFYHNDPDSPTTSDTEVVSQCPSGPSSRMVNPYGVDYIRFTCPGTYTLDFTGSTLTSLLPVDPHSGSYAFWSNKGDNSDMTLTRQFNLSAGSSPVNLSYWTWYDLEKDYDYVFLEASTDGVSWKILTTPSGTDANPSGNSYGWGYNGSSNGWIQETVDLSQYAGKVVSLRFEYVTDAAVNGEGFLFDDVSIPAIGYKEDFESGDGGWVGDGFARIQNVLPQTFRLALITHASTGTTVNILPVSTDETSQIPVTIGSDHIQDVVLVVTATTRYTRSLAAYQFNIH